jgi:small subunit ribosomal protein S6
LAKVYETVIIVDAMIPEEAIDSEFDAIEDRISAKGKLIKIDRWGRRKLAYDIKGRSYGEYAVFYYEAESSFPSELERGFRINENILRWLTVVDNPAGIPEDRPEEPQETKESSPPIEQKEPEMKGKGNEETTEA